MTTDTRPKEAALRLEVGGRPVTIGGIAKGVGMLEPHLATMFCFLATDAMVASRCARTACFRRGVDGSFNRVTVDGDSRPATRWRCWPTAWPRTGAVERGGRGLRQFAAGACRR